MALPAAFIRALPAIRRVACSPSGRQNIERLIAVGCPPPGRRCGIKCQTARFLVGPIVRPLCAVGGAKPAKELLDVACGPQGEKLIERTEKRELNLAKSIFGE